MGARSSAPTETANRDLVITRVFNAPREVAWKAFAGRWVFREIVAPERMVIVSSFARENKNPVRNPLIPTGPLETLSTSTFTQRSGPHHGHHSNKADRCG